MCATTPPYGPDIGANNEAVLAPLNATGNLAYSYQSTAIEAWLDRPQLDEEGRGRRGSEGHAGRDRDLRPLGDRYVLTLQGYA